MLPAACYCFSPRREKLATFLNAANRNTDLHSYFFLQYFNSKFIFSYMIASFFTEFPFDGISHPMIPWFLHPLSPRSKPKKASPGNDCYILEKNFEKSDTVINTYFCFTNKTTMEKDNRNSTKAWFSHLEYSQFHEKSKTVCLEIYILIIDLANKLNDIDKFMIPMFHFMLWVK